MPEVPALPPEDIPDDEPGLLPHIIVIYLVGVREKENSHPEPMLF